MRPTTADRAQTEGAAQSLISSFLFVPKSSALRPPLFSVPTASTIDRFARLGLLARCNQSQLGRIRREQLVIKGQPSLTGADTTSSDLTRRRTCKPTLGPIARNHISYTHFPMSTQDYFARVKGTAHVRPTTPSEGTGTARTDVLKTNLRSHKPTGSNMVSNSVNKTALHPGGVE
jgi:hypothetical protein